MEVHIYQTNGACEPERIGTFRLVDGQVVAEPAKPTREQLLNDILQKEIGWLRKGQPLIGITAISHPKEWLETLLIEYQGNYLWASKVKL